MFRIYETAQFSKDLVALERDEQEFIQKIVSQLKSNAHNGKPLRGRWFREKRFRDRRLCYIIHEDKVLLILFAGKKQQQEIIDEVVSRRERYMEVLRDA